MSSPIGVLRARRTAGSLAPSVADARWMQRRVAFVRGLLFPDVLGFTPGASILHIPSTIARRQARPRLVPHNMLPDGVVHRGRGRGAVA